MLYDCEKKYIKKHSERFHGNKEIYTKKTPEKKRLSDSGKK